MRLQCPSCNYSSEVDGSKIPPSAVTAICPRCKTSFQIRPDHPKEELQDNELLVCPKCSHRQPPQEECVKCGIIFSKYKAPSTESLPVTPKLATNETSAELNYYAGTPKTGFVLVLSVFLIIASLLSIPNIYGTWFTLLNSDLNVYERGNAIRYWIYASFMYVLTLCASFGLLLKRDWARKTLIFVLAANIAEQGWKMKKLQGVPITPYESIFIYGSVIGFIISIVFYSWLIMKLLSEDVAAVFQSDETSDDSLLDKIGGMLWKNKIAFSVIGMTAIIVSSLLFAPNEKKTNGFFNGKKTEISTKPNELFEAVAKSYEHNVILRKDGTVWTWGNNNHGQIGDGGQDDVRALPYRIPGLSEIVAVSAGSHHTIGLKKDGTIWAWGANGRGQLGNGADNYSISTPVQVAGLSNMVGVTSGKDFNIAIKDDGSVWAWGDNLNGQLGDYNPDRKTYSNTPVETAMLVDIVAVSCGEAHALAVRRDGTVWSWGNNQFGQIGDGTNENRYIPVQIEGLKDIVSVAAKGFHSAALSKDGKVWLWGDVFYSQERSKTYSTVPILVEGLSGVKSISRGGLAYVHMGNGKGQMLSRSLTRDNPFSLTRPYGGLENVDLIDEGIAVTRDGVLWTWGANYSGQLGDGTTEKREGLTRVSLNTGIAEPLNKLPESPVAVDGSAGRAVTIKSISGGDDYTIAVAEDGYVWAWGKNDVGQIGGRKGIHTSLPLQVQGISDVYSVAAGFNQVIALKRDGTVWTWGNRMGAAPLQVKGLLDVAFIASGSNHFLALKKDGTLWAWGWNGEGQLGNGQIKKEIFFDPVQVNGIEDIKAISAGRAHSAALTGDGTVWTWGRNEFGQLGDDSKTDSSVPVQVTGIDDISALTACGTYTVALKRDGTASTWGNNINGDSGNGMRTRSSLRPVPLLGIKDISKVACGGQNNADGGHAIVLKSDGTVWTWGSNFHGQLGNEKNLDKDKSLSQVKGLEGIVDVAAGGRHSVALKSDGTLWTWGGNFYGPLGNGSPFDSLLPVQVKSPFKSK